jgi:hypothetical protein
METGHRLQRERILLRPRRLGESWIRLGTEGKMDSYPCGREAISIGENSSGSLCRLFRIWVIGALVYLLCRGKARANARRSIETLQLPFKPNLVSSLRIRQSLRSGSTSSKEDGVKPKLSYRACLSNDRRTQRYAIGFLPRSRCSSLTIVSIRDSLSCLRYGSRSSSKRWRRKILNEL